MSSIRGHVVSAAHAHQDAIVDVEGDRIRAITPTSEWAAARPDSPLPEFAGTILPGLVDIHCHGGGGHRFDSADPAEAEAAAAFHHRAGTTTVVAGLVTAPEADMIAQAAALREVAEAGAVAGILAEGPFLSPSRCGAHDPRHLRAPDTATTTRLLAAAGGHLRAMTLAPELPGADAVARRVADAGVTVALGHSDADHDRFRSALAPTGVARLVTHLGNGMPAPHHRAPGPVAAALVAAAGGEAVVELIADGHHVAPGFAALCFAAATGPATNHLALVSDAVAAAGDPDGDHRLGARDISVRDGVARLADGTLAGSTATLLDCVRWAVTTAGIPLATAVASATAVPARTLGLPDVGDLRTDWFADLVILDHHLQLRGVLRHGQWLT